MVFGFSKKKTKDAKARRKSKTKGQTEKEPELPEEKIMTKEEVAEVLLLEDLMDKKSDDDAIYTKICHFYMVCLTLLK